jgi:hypothetical protein
MQTPIFGTTESQSPAHRIVARLPYASSRVWLKKHYGCPVIGSYNNHERCQSVHHLAFERPRTCLGQRLNHQAS